MAVMFVGKCLSCYELHEFVYTLGEKLEHEEFTYECPTTKTKSWVARPAKVKLVEFPTRDSVIVRPIGQEKRY